MGGPQPGVEAMAQRAIKQYRGALDALAAYDRGECVCDMLPNGRGDDLCPVHGSRPPATEGSHP